MVLWDDIVAFVRGTRQRPPPGPPRRAAMLLFLAAALLHLPLVYYLIRDVALQPAFTLTVGLLAMGLAWCGGASLEGRRNGTARLMAAFGLGEGALAFVPVLADSLGPARWLFAAIAVISAAALITLLPTHPSSR